MHTARHLRNQLGVRSITQRRTVESGEHFGGEIRSLPDLFQKGHQLFDFIGVDAPAAARSARA